MEGSMYVALIWLSGVWSGMILAKFLSWDYGSGSE